jgi:hypothetical protein
MSWDDQARLEGAPFSCPHLHLRWNLFSKNRRAVHCVYLNTMTDCRHRQSRRHKELAMFKHSALLAIAASATVGLTMLAPTDASARNGGPHFHAGRIVAGNFHARFYNHRGFDNQRVFINRRFVAGPVYGYNWRWGVRPGFCWRHPFYCRAHFGGYRIGAVPVVRPVPVVAAPALPAVGCLRQIRLADGSSLFRNLCTNEAAITGNLPEGEPAPLK